MADYEVNVELNKDVYFCSCGLSKNLPFCDGTHQKTVGAGDLKPIKVKLGAIEGDQQKVTVKVIREMVLQEKEKAAAAGSNSLVPLSFFVLGALLVFGCK